MGAGHYRPGDPDCPIHVAVRKVFHWERTDKISTEEFRENVVERTLFKVKSDFHNKQATGMSFADWRAQIGNLDAFLTRIARHASIEVARDVLHLRVKKERIVKATGSSLLSRHDPTRTVLAFLCEKTPLLEQRDRVELFRHCGPCLERLKMIKLMLQKFLSSGRMNPDLISLVKLIGMEKEAIKLNWVSS